jgi:hypothetical protein
MVRNGTDITATEEASLTAFMQRLHQTPLDVSPGIASADVLWLKLQLIRRWNEQRKVRVPLDVMEPVEIAATAIAAMLLLFWALPSALDWLPSLMF